MAAAFPSFSAPAEGSGQAEMCQMQESSEMSQCGRDDQWFTIQSLSHMTQALRTAMWQQDPIREEQEIARCFTLNVTPGVRQSSPFASLRHLLHTLCGHPSLSIANKASRLLRKWESEAPPSVSSASLDKPFSPPEAAGNSDGISDGNADDALESLLKKDDFQSDKPVPKPSQLSVRDELKMWNALHSLGLSDLTPALLRAGLDVDSMHSVSDEHLEAAGLSPQERFRVQYALKNLGGGANLRPNDMLPGPPIPGPQNQVMAPGMVQMLQNPFNMGIDAMPVDQHGGQMTLYPQNFSGPMGMWSQNSQPRAKAPRQVSRGIVKTGKSYEGDTRASTPGFVCALCGATSTPQRRHGPARAKELCNACGLRWARTRRSLDPKGAPLSDDDDVTAADALGQLASISCSAASSTSSTDARGSGSKGKGFDSPKNPGGHAASPRPKMPGPRSFRGGQGGEHCALCRTTVSSQWRHGPARQKELCNACGLRWARIRRTVDPAAPISSAALGGSSNTNNVYVSDDESDDRAADHAVAAAALGGLADVVTSAAGFGGMYAGSNGSWGTSGSTGSAGSERDADGGGRRSFGGNGGIGEGGGSGNINEMAFSLPMMSPYPPLSAATGQ